MQELIAPRDCQIFCYCQHVLATVDNPRFNFRGLDMRGEAADLPLQSRTRYVFEAMTNSGKKQADLDDKVL